MLVALATTACDDTFSPIEPSDLHFSIFGYLDPSADTQWIRITPTRVVTATRPGPLDAEVMLVEEGTGRVIELRDSVFRYEAADTTIGSEGSFFHNYWTTERIDRGATYHFSAELEGQAPSEATVSIPAPYGVELLIGQGKSPPRDILRLVGLKHVAFVESITHYIDPCTTVTTQRLRFTNGSAEDDVQTISIAKPNVRTQRGCDPPLIENQQIWIVGSGAEWPAGEANRPGSLGTAKLPSNISHGLGYLGGVLSHLIPYDGCRIEGATTSPTYCELHYDSTSVTLRGTVTEILCRGQTVVGASVELRELGDPSPEGTKVRLATTNIAGEFVVGALQGDRPYALSIQRDNYVSYADTLQFTPGEEATTDVVMAPLECDE